MKYMLVLMPYIYCYLAGLTISWGAYVSLLIFELNNKTKHKCIHLTKPIGFIVMGWIIGIAATLFVFPDITSTYLNIFLGLVLLSNAVLFYLSEMLAFVYFKKHPEEYIEYLNSFNETQQHQ